MNNNKNHFVLRISCQALLHPLTIQPQYLIYTITLGVDFDKKNANFQFLQIPQNNEMMIV